MRFTFYILIILFLTACSLSPEKSDQNSNHSSPLAGLHEGDLTHLGKENTISINDSTLIYTPEGELVAYKDVLEKLISGNYIAVPYVDQEGDFMAVVIRKATAEEKQKFKQNKLDGTSNRWLKKELPSMEIEDIHGKKWSVAELKGKVTVINFWFINCKPCQMEIPELNKIVEEYDTNEEIVFLAFAEDQKSDLEQFLELKQFKYNIIPASNDISKALGIEAFPTHMVLNKKGVVAYTFTGYGAETVDAIRHEINALLKA